MCIPSTPSASSGVRSSIGAASTAARAIVVLGQDPATHETIGGRILVGEAGQRIQGFLARLGITTSYVMINTFLYSVYGQGGGEKHKDDPLIAKYRNQWLDKLIVGQSVEAVVTLGRLADQAFQAWRATPKGQASGVFQQAVTHPTYPESSSASGQTTKAEAMAKMLENWNVGLQALAPHITQPDVPRPLELYGTALEDSDLAPIPEADLPAGLPPWMRSLKAWASRARPAVPHCRPRPTSRRTKPSARRSSSPSHEGTSLAPAGLMTARLRRLRDGDRVVEVDVLDRVQQLDAFVHRALERLAAGDQSHAAAALVDDRGAHRFGEVALALRLAAAS